MQKKIILLSAIILLNGIYGCAIHRVQRSKDYKGYVVARFGYVIPEYTVNLDKQAPDNYSFALERYKRRKDRVESAYLEMGAIESYFRRYIWHFPMIIWSVFANTLKMPFHIVSAYKYEHNEKYRQTIDERDADNKAIEQARIKIIKARLYEYIKDDMEKEIKKF